MVRHQFWCCLKLCYYICSLLLYVITNRKPYPLISSKFYKSYIYLNMAGFSTQVISEPKLRFWTSWVLVWTLWNKIHFQPCSFWHNPSLQLKGWGPCFLVVSGRPLLAHRGHPHFLTHHPPTTSQQWHVESFLYVETSTSLSVASQRKLFF